MHHSCFIRFLSDTMHLISIYKASSVADILFDATKDIFLQFIDLSGLSDDDKYLRDLHAYEKDMQRCACTNFVRLGDGE